ncbi:MAG: transposase, partial [Gemmatimonadaceae bacterium]
MVDRSAHLMTDERGTYKPIGAAYASHNTVRHKDGEYVRLEPDVLVTTNTIEGFFAGLKRQIKGTHHAVSQKHLHRYVSESEFKYNHRKLDDGERTVCAIRGADGKRLTYKQQTGKE